MGDSHRLSSSPVGLSSFSFARVDERIRFSFEFRIWVINSPHMIAKVPKKDLFTLLF